MTTIEITAKAKEYKELQNFIKQLQDEADALKAAITAEMETQNVDTLQTDLFTIRYTEYTASRFQVA